MIRSAWQQEGTTRPLKEKPSHSRHQPGVFDRHLLMHPHALTYLCVTQYQKYTSTYRRGVGALQVQQLACPQHTVMSQQDQDGDLWLLAPD